MFASVCNGQESRLGLLANYIATSSSSVHGEIPQAFLISPNLTPTDGFRVGVFGLRPVLRGYYFADLTYGQGWFNASITDLQPTPNNQIFGSGINFFSGHYQIRSCRLNAGRAIRLRKNIYLEGGASLNYQLPNLHFRELPDASLANGPTVVSEEIHYRIANAYNRFVFAGRLAVVYQFGPLRIHLAHDRSITSLTGRLQYNGAAFPITTHLHSLSLGFDYSILHKKQNRSGN